MQAYADGSKVMTGPEMRYEVEGKYNSVVRFLDTAKKITYFDNTRGKFWFVEEGEAEAYPLERLAQQKRIENAKEAQEGMNEIITVLGISCYEKDGVAYLNLEACARGLGFTQTETKNGTEYCTVKWARVFGYLDELGFDHKCTKDMFIPENIFYRLAMKAKNEFAEKFQAKIADEVIPAIRKHGGYLTPEKVEEVLLNPDTIIKLATNLKAEQEQRKALEAKVEQDKPKVLFADNVSASENDILVGEMAKILKQGGVDTGEKRLFERLREDGYLINRKGSDRNMPTQKSMDMGLMRIKETTSSDPAGNIFTHRTTKITGKGQVYFANRYGGRAGVQQACMQDFGKHIGNPAM